jgi:peptidoglycan-N-acetylglucosamine deacetylase
VTPPSILKRLVDSVFGLHRRLHASRAVLLTFDDGPHPEVTPAVLERLAAAHARAVFFVVGNRICKAPHLLTAVLAAGHALGNHTYSHHLGRDPLLVSYCRDVRRCQQMLTAATGQTPRFFRAPMGRRSLGALLTPRLLGLQHLLWSVDSHDWKLRSHEAAVACAHQLCEAICPGDIVLLHDDNPWVPTVLDLLLPRLSSQGIDLYSGLDCL